jgi:adenylate cyclase
VPGGRYSIYRACRVVLVAPRRAAQRFESESLQPVRVARETGRLSQVTVLFADCRGYTRLTHELGIEKLTPITEEFFKMSAEIITEQHGIVDHFLGDAIMALFNVPIKHDDHALRAVTAAFRIQDGVERINANLNDGVHLGVGIGIATGTALATNMGSTNCNDYTMVGDSINIASRLQGKAATGEILVTEEAYKSISTAFPGAVRVEYLLKGISQPIAARRLSHGPP